MAKRKSAERLIHSGRQFESLMFPRAARARREEQAPRALGERRAAEELRRVVLPPLGRTPSAHQSR